MEDNDRRAFLRWFVVAVATSVAMLAMTATGLVGEVWRKDSSYLSAITLAFFAVMTAMIGHATWRASKAPPLRMVKYGTMTSSPSRQDVVAADLKKLLEYEEVGWFGAEMCLVMGMLGTIIGFVMMLTGFETLNVGEASSIQGLLGELGKSMATALYTTLVGLACGSVLKIQCFNLGLEIRAKLGKEDQ